MQEDYITAQKLGEILDRFPDYAEDVQDMRDTIKAKKLFYDAIAAGNLVNAFSYLRNNFV